MTSEPKLRKIPREVENSTQVYYDVRHWISSIISLCTNNYMSHITLTPVKIKNCNATASNDTSFTKAFCDAEHYDEGLVFGDVFHKGMDILVKHVQENVTPTDRPLQVVLQKLLDFLDGERSICFHDPQKLQHISDTELTILVTNHLLANLAASSCFLINKNYRSVLPDDWCLCDNDLCELKGQYGDTSIGNIEVWHGNSDIIISNDLAVAPLDEQPEIPSEKSAFEVNLRTALSKNPQLIAQTIVFSFLQKKIHPEREH